MSDPTAALTDHAARLLVGTGLDPAHATLIASGQMPADSLTARALRDGWTAADTLPDALPTLPEEGTS